MKVDDVLGLGKAGEKLVDVVSKGVGSLYTDWVSPHAEVRRTKMLSAAETETEHRAIIAQTESMLEADALAKRAGKRLLVQEIRRQNNIERVISLTADQLDNAEMVVSETPVNDDWAARFFEVVKDVQDSDVQKIWAKILAGEIVKPGSFGLRTLETMRNITQQEAELFVNKVCPFIIGSEMIVKIEGDKTLEDFGITYSAIMHLRDAGLVLDGDTTIKDFQGIQDKNIHLAGRTNGVLVRSTRSSFALPVYVLSIAGKELFSIQDCETNNEYITAIDMYLKNNGFIDEPPMLIQ